MARNRKFDGRKDAESKEGYATVKTDLPETRVQDEKQVLTPDQLGVTDASNQTQSNPKTMAAKHLKSKMSIRPEVSVDILEGKQVGGVPLAATQATRSVAGGASVSPADDRSTIPYSDGRYRPETRYGKKRSQELFEMDNTISEQIEVEVEDALDLRESPDSLQGYNGRKQFKQSRGKKNAVYNIGQMNDGTAIDRVPQQLLMEASLDFVRTKKEVYTCGQMIDGQVRDRAGYPTFAPSTSLYPAEARTDNRCPTRVPEAMRKANYTPLAFEFTVDNGRITNPHIIEQCHIVDCDPVARDQANMNGRLDEINVTHSVLKLQYELGRETTDKWSPLGYVVDQPYETNMLMHDIEATSGAAVAAAYRAASSSLAFQKNILSKDGIGPQAAAIRMILDGYAPRLASSADNVLGSLDFNRMIWNQSEYRAGSPAAIIEMFDSTRKYRTKADLMGMQRSFGLHLSQVDNNINPFHVKGEFIKAIDKAHMFSTVSGEYNPMLPIFVTDEIKLTNPLSLDFFLRNWVHPNELETRLIEWFPDRDDEIEQQIQIDARNAMRERYNRTSGTFAMYTYDYRDIRDVYHNNVTHPLIDGVMAWLLRHEGAVASTFGNGTVTIPMTMNLTAPGLWSFIVCSASEYIALARNVVFRDIIFAGDQMTYIWDDLKDLGTLDPLYSTQLKINSYTEALTLGKLSADTVVRELWAEHFSVMDYDGSRSQYLAPWYFNERSFGEGTGSYTLNEGFFAEHSAFNMTIPSIRDGVRHEYVDAIKSMTERDIRLSMDRLVTIPCFNTKDLSRVDNPVYSSTARNAGVNNTYIRLSTLRYDGNSDGRVVITVDAAAGANNRDWTSHAFRCTPRELGWIAPWYGPDTVTLAVRPSDGDRHDPLVFSQVVSSGERKLTTTGSYGYVFSGPAALYLQAYRVQHDGITARSIDRAAALTQVYYTFHANHDMDVVNKQFLAEIGIMPCLAANANHIFITNPVFNLDSNNAPADGTVINRNVNTFTPVFWSMTQRCLFPVNRFENCVDFHTSANVFDPMEQSFCFGVCGTLASDFTQDILERLDRYDQLGISYTEDTFIMASPIFK